MEQECVGKILIKLTNVQKTRTTIKRIMIAVQGCLGTGDGFKQWPS
jgi:hypothetical protein